MVKDMILDYGARVPFEDEKRAPFVINADPEKDPNGRPFSTLDFIPGPVSPKKRKMIQNKSTYTGRVVLEDVEFEPGDKAIKRTEDRNARVLAAAKKLYKENKAKREQYHEAQRLWNGATEEEKADPTPELARARKIMERTKPLTKEQAMTAAKECELRSIQG